MKQLDPYRAISIIEGMEIVETREEVLEAWQYLVDTDLAWTLQGSIGRMAAMLIESGEILPKNRRRENVTA